MSAPDIQLSERESREYCLGAALLERSGLAWEISDQIQRELPAEFIYRGGLLVPHSLSTRAGLDSATATKGTELKFQQPKPFIEALRAKAVILRLGATVLTGLTGDVKIPRITAGSTPGAKTENSGADQADSDITLDQASLIPKEYQDTTAYTLQLLAQSRVSSDVDNLIRSDLARAHGVKIDADVIAGSGAGGAMTGITGAAGVDTTTIAGGVNGLAATWANLTGLERVVALANAEQKFADAPDGTEAYLMPPAQRDKLRNKDRTAGTSGWMCISDDQVINEYPVAVSTSVPSTLTKGTSVGNCSAIIFGRFSEVIIGFWGALEIIADPFRLKKQGKVELTSYQLVGTMLRHGQSFAAMLDAL